MSAPFPANQPAVAFLRPEVTTCPVCRSSAHYAGTQERIRFYVCDANPQHLVQFKPGEEVPPHAQ